MSLTVPQRLVSLDAFRGITIASMILVNNPGSWDHIYPQLEHAPWSGWTFTDTVFPFFLWTMGVAITLSSAKRVEQGADRRKLVLHIVRRAVLLYAFGFFLAGFPYFHLEHIRFLGVLQRISICYLVSATLFVFTTWRSQIAAIVIVCTVYWLLMAFYPVPGVGAGHFEPEGNFVRYIDGIVLRGHIWSQTKYWDPEGVVSTLPAIATTLFGVLAGHILRLKGPVEKKLGYLLILGMVLVALGQLCTIWMPINKNLWTVSFSCFMAGLATLEFLVLYWIVDVKGWRAWAKPFVIYGMNAIVIFTLSGIIGRLLGLIKVTGSDGKPQALQTFIYQRAFQPLASPVNASLLYAAASVLVLFSIAWTMYKRRWFVRL